MRIAIFPSVISLLFLSCSKEQKMENDLEKMNLKGNVKSIHTSTYNAIEKFGEIQKGAQTFHINGWMDWEYDNKNIDSRVMFTKMGVFDSEINYIFDERGYFIEKNEYRGENIWGKVVYKYDEKGNKIEENIYSDYGNHELKWIYQYDNRNKTEASYYDKNEELGGKWKYNKYDDNGNILEGSRYGKDGKLEIRMKWIFKYDAKGNVIEESQYSKQEWSKEKITPNKFGVDVSKILDTSKKQQKGVDLSEYLSTSDTTQTKQKTSSDEWSFDYQWKYKYDNKGNKIEECEYDKDGTLENKFTYKYDDNGNKIEGKGEKSNGKYEYVFDKLENWIIRTAFENENPTYVVERKIKYF